MDLNLENNIVIQTLQTKGDMNFSELKDSIYSLYDKYIISDDNLKKVIENNKNITFDSNLNCYSYELKKLSDSSPQIKSNKIQYDILKLPALEITKNLSRIKFLKNPKNLRISGLGRQITDLESKNKYLLKQVVSNIIKNKLSIDRIKNIFYKYTDFLNLLRENDKIKNLISIKALKINEGINKHKSYNRKSSVVEKETKKKSSSLNISEIKYEAYLEAVLLDGIIEKNEKKWLEEKRVELGITNKSASKIENMINEKFKSSLNSKSLYRFNEYTFSLRFVDEMTIYEPHVSYDLSLNNNCLILFNKNHIEFKDQQLFKERNKEYLKPYIIDSMLDFFFEVLRDESKMVDYKTMRENVFMNFKKFNIMYN